MTFQEPTTAGFAILKTVDPSAITMSRREEALCQRIIRLQELVGDLVAWINNCEHGRMCEYWNGGECSCNSEGLLERAKEAVGRKYVEWNDKKATGGCPVSGG